MYNLFLDNKDKKLSEDFIKIEKIFKQLQKSPLLTRSIHYQLKVLERSEINAYATVGGAIFITTKLLALKLDEFTLAFILAHEIIHQEQKHLLKSIGFQLTSAILLSPFTELNNLLIFTQRNFSQKVEKEADLLALDLVFSVFPLSQDYDYLVYSKKINSFFNRIYKPFSLSLFSTHPDHITRQTYIKQKLKEFGKK